MEVKAYARRVRMSPRKVRLIVDVVRGMQVEQAQNQLRFSKKAAALPVLKLLNSAIANAENNFSLKKNNLFIKVITTDGGPTLHRWRPRAMGKAAPIRKRTSHISIVLDEVLPTVNKTVVNKDEKVEKAVKELKPSNVKPVSKKETNKN